MEGRVGGSELVDNYPGKEEIDLIVVPQVKDLVVIVFQEDEIDHLAEILEFGSQFGVRDVTNESLHSPFLGQDLNYFHLGDHILKYTFYRRCYPLHNSWHIGHPYHIYRREAWISQSHIHRDILELMV